MISKSRKSLVHLAGILLLIHFGGIGALLAESEEAQTEAAPTEKDLQRLITLSPVIAVGTIGQDMIGATELGVISFNFSIEVEDVIKGEGTLIGQTLRVSSGRYIQGDRGMYPPHLQPENRVVIFMRPPRHSGTPNVVYPWSLVSAERGLRIADEALIERLRSMVASRGSSGPKPASG